MQQSNIETFSDYSLFSTLKSFNSAIEQWMVDFKDTFTASEQIALKRLIRFSAKYRGICNARINTILNAIKEKDTSVGLSRSTFKRMILKAKSIGLLVVKETVRGNQSQSSNLYIFQPYATNEPPRTENEQIEVSSDQQEIVEQLNHPKASNLFKTNNLKQRTYTDNHQPDIIPDWLINKNPELVSTASIYFQTQEVIEFMKSYMSVSKSSKLPQNELISCSVDALKQTIYRMRSFKRIRNKYAYYTGVLKKKVRTAQIKQLWEYF
jgi:hypothetical protein